MSKNLKVGLSLFGSFFIFEKIQTKKPSLSVCVGSQPKTPNKSWKRNNFYCGEDAFFISEDNTTIGIADGVGGWRNYGIDPSEFSCTLMENSKLAYEENPNLKPVEILTKGYNLLVKEDKVKAGSSTACIVSLKGNDLHFSNLGDSTFLLIRPPNQIIYRAPEQQHYFNAPYQLAYVTPSLRKHHNFISDPPKTSFTGQIQVQNGDLIVLATDGVFDNLYNEKILEIASSTSDLKEITQKIINTAYEKSNDNLYFSPFSYNASLNGLFSPGGKPDDITVIVGRVETK